MKVSTTGINGTNQKQPMKAPRGASSRSKGARPIGRIACWVRWLAKELRRVRHPRSVRLYLAPNASPARVAAIRGRIARLLQGGYPVQAFPSLLLERLAGAGPGACPFANSPAASMRHWPAPPNNATRIPAAHPVPAPFPGVAENHVLASAQATAAGKGGKA